MSKSGVHAERPISTQKFDTTYSLLSIWFIGGLALDTWAHSFNMAGAQETFFTPWHALFYSGYMALVILLGIRVYRNRRDRSLSWRDAIPAGYEISVIGMGMWVLGGGLDPLWHTVVGREVRLDILMSPTHIFFAVANILIISGPLRAAWRRPTGTIGWREFLPVLISAMMLHWMFTFQTLYNHPIEVFPSPYRRGNILAVFSDVLGTTGFIIHTAILMAVVLILLRRWRLPFGTLGLMLGAHYGLLAFQHYYYDAIVPLVVAMVLGGFACDLLAAWLKPSFDAPGNLRLFAFLMPVVLYSFYFVSLVLFDGVLWTFHLVLGNIALTGLVGLGLAALMTLPPPPLVDTTTG